MSRFQFVADHRDTFEVKWLCETVEISRSSFYAWLDGAQARAERAAADDALAVRIAAVHEQDRTYGARGSPPSSMTARSSATTAGSTTSGSRG